MRQEFQCTLGEMAMSLQVAEAKPPEGKDTEVHSDSLRVMHTHCQHMADYVRLLMEHRERLTLGEDQATPLITEVHSYYFCFPVIFTDIYAFYLHLIFDIHLSVGITKICLANHVWRMADLLHSDAIQQLGVAVMGSPVVQVVDLLAGGLTLFLHDIIPHFQPLLHQHHPFFSSCFGGFVINHAYSYFNHRISCTAMKGI